MLALLNSAFRILAYKPPANVQQKNELQQHFGSVPGEYLRLVSEVTELELLHNCGTYVRIWGPAGCIEMDQGYNIRKRITSAIPIGDDGGGRVLFYQSGQQGFGIYLVGYGNLDGDDAIWIAPTLASFLMDATGINSF